MTAASSGLPAGSRIWVAGHTGLAGSALVRRLRAAGYGALVTRTHAELDLVDARAVRALLEAERPDVVVLAAARVGGIVANQTRPADFVLDNLCIEVSVLGEALRAGVRRLVLLGSSCIYPRESPQPIRESDLLGGPLERTNRPYAVAKIAGVELCWAFNRQHDTEYVTVMPSNLYGPGDHFDLETSHVVPAMLRKMHEAKLAGDGVTLWGTGTPRRELLHADDLADACVFLLSLGDAERRALFPPGEPPIVNVGWGEDVSIRELAALVADVVGFTGPVRWDVSRPDGTPRKLLDVSRLRAAGWRPRIGLREGLERTYRDYLAGQGAGRAPDGS